ncbi:class I SAM-dependent methyltransferase [Pseudomonas quasicaspiana]|uniref:class I SAM-dependent methyltransferase n=1 Tax=Pseudomonas quasicaspiana TaxID=2829821 RepID=UPI001E3C70B6|nr:class I SAM-dependent methyltransferase [Pseudomonas quasicaspiana]MCD5971713.1 methyltransferase [Pseudomonas quasicaspiana]
MSTARTHQEEILNGERFSFGENWSRFLSVLNEDRIKEAETSLKSMLEVNSLEGKTFLDIGSGSGLFSLAARRLGAKVYSFDFDPQSVACTQELKRRYFKDDSAWTVESGSILDKDFISTLGKFDIVYSWGVLHHTGAMWVALENAESLASDRGSIFIAIYNFQPIFTKYWTFVKKTFNKFKITRPIFMTIHTLYPIVPSLIINTIKNRKIPRGMNIWYDLKDWLGGYPFETAKPEEILDLYRKKGYQLNKLITVGGRMGCNEFVFRKTN